MSDITPARGLIRRGPAKRRLQDPPPPQYTTDKVRATWFQTRAVSPELGIEHLIAERALFPRPAFDWEFAGPSNIGGRATALVAHPTIPDLIFLGSASGGVWVSRDAGRNWTALWHSQDVLSIGSLAIDPANPNVLYAGTGEANLSGDNYAGVGIYRSTDGGESWSLLSPTASTPLPGRIGAIAVDPADSNHILAGGVGMAGERPGGLCVTRDGGATWTRETTFGSGAYRCHSILFHPAGGLIYAAIDAGVLSGIWRSDNDGATWTQLREGLPPGGIFGRISLALCRARPESVYALAANRTSGVLGVFRTINGGEIWSSVSWDYFGHEGQMSYNNCIAVHPDDPDLVFCGGMDLHRTADGGRTWTQPTEWTATRGNDAYAHADHHALAIPLTNSNRIYDANDGGMDYSEDRGVTWTNRSNTLGNTQFYGVDVAQSDGRCYGGGSQDNGTLLTDSGRPDSFFQALGGDGGYIAFDPRDAAHVYASYQHMNIFRHRAGEQWTRAEPDDASAAERAGVWSAELVIDPRFPTTVFTASNRVWRTHNDGETWNAVSPNLDNSDISALHVCGANPRVVYVGTDNGGIFRSVDGGNSWTQNLAAAPLPGRAITGFGSHPKDPANVFVSVGGARVTQPYRHVFRSVDSGAAWRDADRGALPNVPFHSVTLSDSEEPFLLFAACDVGVFQSADLGETWTNISGNLPLVVVTGLAWHTIDRTLTISTYGRSLWRLKFPPAQR